MSFFRGKITTPFYLVGTRNLNGGASDASGIGVTLYYLYYLSSKIAGSASDVPPTNGLDIGFYALPVSYSELTKIGSSFGASQALVQLAQSLIPIQLTASGSGSLYTLTYNVGGNPQYVGYNTTGTPVLSPTLSTTTTFAFYQQDFDLSSQSLYAGVKYKLQASTNGTPTNVLITYLKLVNPNDKASIKPTTTDVIGELIGGDKPYLTCNNTNCHYAIVDGANYTFNSTFTIPSTLPQATFTWMLLPTVGYIYHSPIFSGVNLTIPYNPATVTGTKTTMLDIFEIWSGINTQPGLTFSQYCSAYSGDSNIPSGTSQFLTQAMSSDGTTPLWSGCIFTKQTDYQSNGQAYWYSYCPSKSASGTTNDCGSCYGICGATPTSTCQRDYSIPPSATAVPLSCNPKQPTPASGICAVIQTNKTIIIIIAIVFGVLLLGGLLVLLLVTRTKTTNSSTSGLKYNGGATILKSSDL